METVFFIIVIVLILLAVSDLIVGVSNDAVNFLNSAIGSKAAPFWIIMGIASVGIIVGTTFSSGMMEVARKEIFSPDKFLFKEIIFIFFAVMITDIILLDTFNTFGLPTSTTVSIVFELLGASVAYTVIKLSNGAAGNFDDYINTAKALGIISGILLSVVIAFTVGAIIQTFVRLVFTYNYKNTIKKFGGLWGGFAITAITYFILIKGAKGSSFLSDEVVQWIKTHALTIIFSSFAFWFIIMQFLASFTKVNILKVIVLIGTFALAMAFAGNDLVNFIGVPLAGLKSYQVYLAEGNTLMSSLGGEVETPTLYLIIAGLIMVITLWMSKKAKTVTQTEISLARQEEGYERFESNMFSRSVVRSMVWFKDGIHKILPQSANRFIARRLDSSQNVHVKDKSAMFDLLRASVNLSVASILISYATSLKLPLSTTYVTFMVAMGSSLADGAWGRDSAVYRISGVVSVILGWFLTAFIAFTVAFTFALFLYKAEAYAVFILIVLTIFAIYRSLRIHRKRELKNKDVNEAKKTITIVEKPLDSASIFSVANSEVIDILRDVSKNYNSSIVALKIYNRHDITVEKHNTDDISTHCRRIKSNIPKTVSLLREEDIESAPYYVQVIDFLREVVNANTFIVRSIYKHIDNSHKPLIDVQLEELDTLINDIENFIEQMIDIMYNSKYVDIENLIESQQNLLNKIKSLRKNQIKRIKDQKVGTRNSNLYFNILGETKNLLLHSVTLVKAQRDFVVFNNN